MNKPFRKLYFPGLISLAFLPLMLVGYFLQNNYLKKTYGIEVIWGNKTMIKSWAKYQKRTFDISSFRKFNRTILTGSATKDSCILNNFEENIRKLAISNDTINGYSLSFLNHVVYENIIKAVDICSRQKNEGVNFILYENKILAWKGDSYQSPPIVRVRMISI